MTVPGLEAKRDRVDHQLLSETGLWDLKEVSQVDLISDNDLSIGIFLEYLQTRVLLMADIEKTGELALIKKPLIKDVDIIKIGHHGAKTSSSIELLTKVTPEISIISVGKNNRYNHPHPQVIDNLEEIGAEIYRTDVHGDVEVIINENGYYIN
jgi:competence protein ComEC